uniref:Uncharacterized protein n=1 Tax=Magallana gigas TaxID=29159 RepID=K1Q4T7_MAGGI
MWFKLILLLIYVAVLFVLARVLEAVSWIETGVLSHRLLDPMTLSVLKLKTLLEQRGVSYEGVVEKPELSELVDTTGLVTEGEVIDAGSEESCTATNFTGGSHFLEQVEDAKDSVWLVRVIAKQWNFQPPSERTWTSVINKVTKFGVRVGNFHCKTDYRFCHMKNWDSTRLILGLPQNFQSKSQVQLYTYSGNHRLVSISHWIKDTVNRKVLVISDPGELNRNWISYTQAEDPEIRIIMVSKHSQVPLFYSALSVRFPGRIRFGVTSKEVLIRTNLVPYGLRLIRLFGSTDTMTFIRADVKFYCQHLLLVELSLGLYLLFLGLWFYKESSEEEADQEWNFAQFRTLEHLFYPLHPRSLSHLDRNAFLEWNQQEIPSLWMAAHMSSDYIKLLPTWSYIIRDQSTECAGSNTQPAYSTTNNRTEQDHPPIQSDNVTPSQSYITTERCPPAQTRPLCVWDYVECSQCVICLEDYEEGVLLCGLPCKHSFHQRCIVVWLQRDNHYCPVCRWPSNKAMPVHVHSE